MDITRSQLAAEWLRYQRHELMAAKLQALGGYTVVADPASISVSVAKAPKATAKGKKKATTGGTLRVRLASHIDFPQRPVERVTPMLWWVDDGATQVRWWEERGLTGLTDDECLVSFFALRKVGGGAPAKAPAKAASAAAKAPARSSGRKR